MAGGRSVQSSPVEPRAFTEGNVARRAAAPSVEDLFAGEEREVVGALLAKMVELLPDERHRVAVQLTQMQGLTYSDAAELMVPVHGRRPHPKTVWTWARDGLEQLAGWVDTTPWLVELAPHLPVTHPAPLDDPVPLTERLGANSDGEPSEEEGDRPRDGDGEAG